MAKKEGPCSHCGVTSTPLWRNGPPDKPVLCNACGVEMEDKDALVNYTPAHRWEDTDADKLKHKGQKQPKKRPNRSIVQDEPCSDQNFWKMGNADTSNRSGSGSAVSYSESCAPYGSVDACEIAVSSAQSRAWDSLVPSRKRSCVTRPKPSPVEELVEDLNSILQEEKLYCLSAGSTEEDLLYHSETPVGSFEIGYGSVLLRDPNSKSVEEESEANSVPADSKSYITSESYSGSASFIAHSEIKGASNSNAASEKLKWSPMQTHDSAKRDELHYSNQHTLESTDSALVSVTLEDNYSKEVEGRGDAGGGFRGLTKSSMRSLKRPYESQPQSFTDADVRGGTMTIASSRSRAMASSWSPLWRHGPPEKPVLCNACGTRWRTKGTLDNYTPARRPEDAEAETKQPKKRPIRRMAKKKPSLGTMLGDADTSNPSGFGSAVSYSVVETLAEDLNSIMHEEKLCSGSGVRTIPGSSEEDLIYHRKSPAGSFEIGYGSMLLRHPDNYSKKVGGRGNAGGAFRGPTKSSMRSLKDLMKASSKASQIWGMPKSGNAAAAALNHFMLPPAAKLTSMLAPPNKNCDQDSLLMEVPRNARPPQAEFLRCCPPPSRLSTAASPPPYQSQLR
ncbi:hypothetical protein ZWY2020_059361 [Hordeum vulgare]|nr:hypothetical protein ZWY2020_059361 [Hordeum vulgare]